MISPWVADAIDGLRPRPLASGRPARPACRKRFSHGDTTGRLTSNTACRLLLAQTIGPMRLQMEGRCLAMSNLPLDSKVRGCDLVGLRIDEVFAGGGVRDRAIVIQEKGGRPVRFEITEQTRVAIASGSPPSTLERTDICSQPLPGKPHLSTWRYLRIVLDERTAPLPRRRGSTTAAADRAQGAAAQAARKRRTVPHYSDHVIGQGREFYSKACVMHFEGIVSKRIDASYAPGKSRTVAQGQVPQPCGICHGRLDRGAVKLLTRCGFG
jgi:hypothetical protein